MTTGVRPSRPGRDPAFLVDCDDCRVRGPACSDCVVAVLLGTPPAAFDDPERRALAVLADSGLVPPLRLVVGGP
jgi:hypothetical protein